MALGTTGEATSLLPAQSVCLVRMSIQEKGKERQKQWEEAGPELQVQTHGSKLGSPCCRVEWEHALAMGSSKSPLASELSWGTSLLWDRH